MRKERIVAEHMAHLRELVLAAIASDGPQCNLNHIDVSSVYRLQCIFQDTEFTGDISQWDVSSANSTMGMFSRCAFNGDISKWNVHNVRDMQGMFENAQFNGDISQWNVSSVLCADQMFRGSAFNGDISAWNVANLRFAAEMFDGSSFSGDVSRWQLPLLHAAPNMFRNTPFEGDLSRWSLGSMDARSAAQMLDPTFKGVPPLVGATFREREDYYRRLFKKRGQNKGMARYLEEHPFNALHLDLSLHSKRKPDGVRQEDYDWVRQARTVGLGLGLAGNELHEHAMMYYAHRMQPALADATYDVHTLLDGPTC